VLRPEALAQRVLSDETVELADHVVVTRERKVSVDPLLQCRKPQLRQARDLSLGKRLEAEVRQRWPPPEGERLPKQSARAQRVTAPQSRLALCHKPLEAVRIQLVATHVQYVAGRSSLQHAVPRAGRPMWLE
jgi:hypothetical protein